MPHPKSIVKREARVDDGAKNFILNNKLETVKNMKQYNMQNITFNSTLDEEVYMRNGFIFEKQRVSYYNPPKLAISIKVDFSFLENAVNYVYEARNTLLKACNRQSTHFKYELFTKERNGFSPCWYPLPIYDNQIYATAKIMANEGALYTYANVKRVNNDYLTLQNEKVPFNIKDLIQYCPNMNQTFTSEKATFLYKLESSSDNKEGKTLSPPCPYDAEQVDYYAPIELCIRTTSESMAMSDVCTERLEETTMQLLALGNGLEQLQNAVIRDDGSRLSKRFAITTLILTISVISSIVGVLGTAMSTAALANDESHDTNIDTLIDESESQGRDIRSLATLSHSNFVQTRSVQKDIAFLIKITLKYEQSRHVFDETKERLNKLFHILDTCKFQRAISSMALDSNQRSFIQKLAFRKGHRIHLPDGICELKKHNHSVFLNFLFPITDKDNKVDIIKSTPIPIYEGDIATAPRYAPTFLAIFHQTKEFVQLTENEFNQCKQSSICESKNPILSAENICGPYNYLMPKLPKSPCDYVDIDPQPLQDFFAHEIKSNSTSSIILSGPTGTHIDVTCEEKSNAGLQIIEFDGRPVKVKTKGICSYRSKKSTYRVSNVIQHNGLIEPQTPNVPLGSHGDYDGPYGQIKYFPKLESNSKTRAMRRTKAIVDHTATGVVTFCLIGIFIILAILFYWYYKTKIKSNGVESVTSVAYNSKLDTTDFLREREFNREYNPVRFEAPSELRQKLNDTGFQDFPTPMPRSQTRQNYENLPNMTTSSPATKLTILEPKRQRLINERNFHEETIDTSPILKKK